MGFAISWQNVRSKVSDSAAWTMHGVFSGGVGYLSGRTINMVDRWLHPVKSALGKPPMVNPMHGAICGIVFAIVDRIAHRLMEQYLPKHVMDNPIGHAGRIVVSIAVSTIITSALLPISVSMAAVLITTNIFVTTLLVSIASYYSKLVYKGGVLPNNKPASVPPAVEEDLILGSLREPKPKPQPAVASA
jgi:hypothetical protein